MLQNLSTALTTQNSLPQTLAFFTTIIVLYAIFVFYFYKFLAKKNIIKLDLNQYNKYSHPALVKIFAVIFYITEYIILLRILTFFWFSILSILILVLAKSLSVSTVLLISTALVSSVRITSYISERLSEDLAKMLPFTLLAIAITTPGFFDISHFFNRISQIPSLFSNVPYYLLFIVAVELIMRIAEFIQSTLHTFKATEDESLSEEETD